MSMEIVDAHMHLWTPHTHPWLEGVRDGGHPAGKFAPVMDYLVQQYTSDTKGFNVSRSVHVEACWPGDDPVLETKWLSDIADANSSGIPHAIVGHCDLSSPNADAILKRHSEFSRMRGIRHMLNYHPTNSIYSEAPHDNFLTDPQFLGGVGLLEKYDMSFEIHVLPNQMQRAADMAKKFPNVRFMLDHCGLPYERDEASMDAWRKGMEEMAACPNVSCKVSGVFATDPHWTQSKTSLASIVNSTIQTFGIDRCVFASNFPVDRVNGTFSELILALMPLLDQFSLQEKQAFFAENAKDFYRLK